MKTRTVLALLSALWPFSALAADPTLPKLPMELGETRVEPGGQNLGIYSVSASGPLDSKSQSLRLIAFWEGPDAETKGFGSTTRTATITSGKSRTLRSVAETVRDALNRFASTSLAPSTVLAKIGDIKYGGELLIVVESPEVVRFDFIKPTGVSPVRFGKKEAVEFAKLLANLPQ